MKIPSKEVPVNVEELRKLCMAHSKSDIYVKLLHVPDDAVFVSDGCSAWPDDIRGFDIYEACFWHDVRYWLGGSEIERVYADCYLAMDVADRGIPDTARIMFTGVSVGGKRSLLKAPWEWGYGNLEENDMEVT